MHPPVCQRQCQSALEPCLRLLRVEWCSPNGLLLWAVESQNAQESNRSEFKFCCYTFQLLKMIFFFFPNLNVSLRLGKLVKAHASKSY